MSWHEEDMERMEYMMFNNDTNILGVIKELKRIANELERLNDNIERK